MKCTKCGGRLERIDELEGSWCMDCNEHHDIELENTQDDLIRRMYSEDRLKAIRGVPTNRMKMGSETKGRIEVEWPINAEFDEIKAKIDQSVEAMAYFKRRVEENGLDIFTGR